MRPLSMLVVGSLLLLVAESAAQTRSTPSSANPALSSVQVSAPARAPRVYQEQLDAVRGVYAMSNGWRMKVEPAAGGIWARIDRRPAMYLVALSPNNYASRDGGMAMEFQRGESGDDMLMRYVPDRRLAQVIVVEARLAQR
ncbi:hypothetical protein IM543_08815 [Massilia sp. UMI-21]|nr:hypothetical protein IM543_08815 [Massilia sp. UMI-21]